MCNFHFYSPFYKTTDRSKLSSRSFDLYCLIISDLTANFDCGLGGFAGTITFTHTFTHTPAVVITPNNTNSNLVWSVIITSITTSGCTYVIKYSENGVNWIEYTPNAVVSYMAMIPWNS